MAWLLLALTIVLEVAGITLMKMSNGFTHFWPSIGVFLCYGGALAGITLVLQELEVSVTYAIWSGAGTAFTAAIGMALFKEPMTLLKIASLALVVAGIVGLQIAAAGNR